VIVTSQDHSEATACRPIALGLTAFENDLRCWLFSAAGPWPDCPSRRLLARL